ncbi:hypothetical protein [Rathayibacter sp. SD072]|uniref:5-methylcytosine restriction system specificity protein McrC n=1 Tax=Rathayibacter sp. SD072 TaxID=2781731 RepID=UPI001A95AA51|nr:hypothetical protein [Rathayibacter sp. SD072]MBO0985004.1 hypothetical protein [Rathayibacter sp. SD072]
MTPGTSAAPRMRECREYGFIPVQRDEIMTPDGKLDIYESVAKLNAFTVDFKGSELRLQAGGIVGIVPINDQIVLRITPRTPMSNLTRMVQRSGYEAFALDALRTYTTASTVSDWVLDIYADSLIRHCDEIRNRGLYRTYIRKTDSGSRPHGHLDIANTVRHFAARGITTKAEFSWFERTTDNAYNRCLKAALSKLHRRYVGPRRGIADSQRRVRLLASLLRAFTDVEIDPQQRYLEDPVVAGLAEPPASRTYYREPLRLAVAVLTDRGISLDEGTGDVKLPSMLLNMGDLFEAYVRTTLHRVATDRSWPVSILDGNKDGKIPLYQSPDIPRVLDGVNHVALVKTETSPNATPDIVFQRDDGTIPLVAELKNTLMKGTLPERSEVNQAVTYATRYGTTNVLLVHPKTDKHAGGLHLIGDVGAVSVFDYRYDLAAADLDAEDQHFARQVGAILGITS